MISVKVLRKVQEATDIASFELGRPDGAPLPAFSAGSHIDVHVAEGLVRQYSLCNDSANPRRYRIAVLRDSASRGGSVGMHDRVLEGDLIQISEPRNHFPLVRAQKTLLLAGGIGVTPLLCMARHLHGLDADFEMHYCTRSRERTAFVDELAAAPFARNIVFHYDDGDAQQKLNLGALIEKPLPDTHIYVCGPAGFIEWVVQTAHSAGWPSDQIHLEYFTAAPQIATGNRAFQIKLASSGAIYGVATDQTVVQALHDHGIDIPVSCEQGVCGTCVTRVLEGECEHRDVYFTDEEKAKNDQFTPCCSRARGTLLVLDL